MINVSACLRDSRHPDATYLTHDVTLGGNHETVPNDVSCPLGPCYWLHRQRVWQKQKKRRQLKKSKPPRTPPKTPKKTLRKKRTPEAAAKREAEEAQKQAEEAKKKAEEEAKRREAEARRKIEDAQKAAIETAKQAGARVEIDYTRRDEHPLPSRARGDQRRGCRRLSTRHT